MTPNISLVLGLLSLSVFAAQPYHTNLRMQGIPAGEELVTFAIDASGNVFTVGYITNAFGQQQIRADKFDPNGNALGDFEFASVSGIFADSVAGAAVDPSGNLVIAGSSDLAILTGEPGGVGPPAASVVKLDSQLKTVLSSTTLGVNGFTMAGAVTLDSTGNIYVTGQTSDTSFPVSSGAFETRIPETADDVYTTYAFLTKIAADGKTILFSTYFGNNTVPCDAASGPCPADPETNGSAIALDAAGNVVIAGYTNTSRLPFPAGAYSSNCGDCGIDASGDESFAGFLAKFSADGTRLLAGTYLPVIESGALCTQIGIAGLAVDGAGNILAAGMAASALPVTAGALQTTFPGAASTDAGFILKFDPAAQQLLFGTYFGGSGEIGSLSYGAVSGVTMDSQGTIWVTGVSPADQLPAPAGTPLLGGAYVAGLSPDGSTLAALFTAPLGFAGLSIASTSAGVVALGPSGALLTASAGAGPSLTGITNSAGLAPATSVAPYELVSLYGLGIGPAAATSGLVSRGVMGDSIQGMQVLFNGTPAPLLYAGPTQINAIVPSEVINNPTTTVEIVNPSGTLTGPVLPVSPSAPGVVLSADQSSDSLLPVAAALNQDGTVNSAINPAAVGSIISVWVSGAGFSTYQVPDGTVRTAQQIGVPTLPVVAFASPLEFSAVLAGLPDGPLSTEVAYAGDAAGMVAGVTQVNVLISSVPARGFGFELPGVPYVFWIEIGGVSSESFTVYTSSGGSPSSTPTALGVAAPH